MDNGEFRPDDSPYGFLPTRWITILFIVLFALTAGAHLFQSIKYRKWWLIPTLVTCGVGEVIGWCGRLWSSWSPYIMDPYLMQICCTVFAPSFMTAAMFIIFGRMIKIIGLQYSRLSPKMYSIIFITTDFAALIVQSIGGATASMAETREGADKGARIMVGGIIVQLAAISVYAIIQVEYLWRVHTERPIRPSEAVPTTLTEKATHTNNSNIGLAKLGEADKSFQSTPPSTMGEYRVESGYRTGKQNMTRDVSLMLLGLVLSTLLVYVRSIYRTIELLDGWNGPIITNEQLFNLLDGMPIFLAMFLLNVFHPGRLIPTTPVERTEALERAASVRV